ncbi:MAG: GNAT family N-acetyltransferase [Candidatus Moraniibacteriota bacterium]
MKIIFRKYKSADQKKLENLMQNFSLEELGVKISLTTIRKTIKEFSCFPEKGVIYVFEMNKILVGYALVINYWCNGYGGNVSAIDEIFVNISCRGTGIASAFIKYLQKNVIRKSVAVSLEVGAKNKKAKQLYKKLGFNREGYGFMIKMFSKSKSTSS